MKNITFIGMMGSGKTVTAVALAQRLGMRVADVDNMIVARVGMTISQAFITFGEKNFREFENTVLCELCWQENLIISCGGGVPLKESNMELLKNYIKVQLTCDPEEIYLRTKDDITRPLLKDNSPKAIRAIYEQRKEVYDSYADITVDTTGRTLDDVVDEIVAKLELLGERAD